MSSIEQDILLTLLTTVQYKSSAVETFGGPSSIHHSCLPTFFILADLLSQCAKQPIFQYCPLDLFLGSNSPMYSITKIFVAKPFHRMLNTCILILIKAANAFYNLICVNACLDICGFTLFYKFINFIPSC